MTNPLFDKFSPFMGCVGEVKIQPVENKPAIYVTNVQMVDGDTLAFRYKSVADAALLAEYMATGIPFEIVVEGEK